MLYNVVLVYVLQPSESAVHIHICTYICPSFRFPSHLGHHRALRRVPLLYSRFSLVIYLYVVMSIRQSQSPNSALPLSRLDVPTFVLYVSFSAVQLGLSVPFPPVPFNCK